MSDWIAAVILGLVEGLTEFIPVSSTGHLLLTKKLLGLPSGFWDTFSVMIQLGAILAVVVVYFQKLWNVLITLPSDPKSRWFATSVLLSVLPSMAIAFVAHDFIKTVLFESVVLICVMLILGGIVLLIVDRWAPEPKEHDAMQLSWKRSLGVGFCQCLAMVPGVSRSGATIVGALMLKVEKRAAAEFSFLLSLPTMIAAVGYDLFKSRHVLDFSAVWDIAIGFAMAFVAAVLVVKWVLSYVSRHGYAIFGWWRIIVGALVLLALQAGW